MKTRFFLISVTVLVFATSSCVEHSGKYKTLLSERDSIALEHNNLESDYNTTLGMLNEVEAGFAMIREAEGRIMVDVGSIENSDQNGKKLIMDQFTQIKEILEDNKQKISQLQRLSNQKNNENSGLKATIERLENELIQRISLADSLQHVISKKNIQIEGLTADLHQVKTDLEEIHELSVKQQDIMKGQDADLNTVWYVVDKLAALKQNNIVNSNGLFRPKSLLDKAFDKTVLTQADLRELKTIPTGAKTVKILSAHPENSYELVKNDDKLVTIDITNAELFWSITKYLVVRTR